MGLFFFLFIPSKKEKIENEIFIVKMVSIPEIKTPEILKPAIENSKPIVSQQKKTFTEVVKSKKEIEKIEFEKRDTFSSEKYKQQLYSKLSKSGESEDISKNFKKNNIDIKIPEIKSVEIEKISSIGFEPIYGQNVEIPTWYISLIQKKIKENWNVKDLLSDLSAIVSFRIYREGKVENIVIEKSSGYEKFDNSIIEAIKKINHWPSFPENIKDRYLDIVIEFKTEG